MNCAGKPLVLRGVSSFLTLALIVALSCLTSSTQSGSPSEELSVLDTVMQQALTRYHVNGGALAIAKDGRLVYARAFGVADKNSQTPVQPQSVFRWCSVSKTVTATAVMRPGFAKKNKHSRPPVPLFFPLSSFL